MKFERVDHYKLTEKESLIGKAYSGRSGTIYIITGIEDNIGLEAEEIERRAIGQPRTVILPNDAFISEEDLEKIKGRFPLSYAKIVEEIDKSSPTE